MAFLKRNWEGLGVGSCSRCYSTVASFVWQPGRLKSSLTMRAEAGEKILLRDGRNFCHSCTKKKSMEKLPVLKLLLTVQNSNQFSTSRLLFHEFWHTLESILTTQTAVRSASSFFVYIYSNRNVTSCTKRSQNKIRNQPFVDSSTPHNGAGSCHFANLTQRYKSDRV